MIELTYRRGSRIPIKVGVGQPSPMSQVPDDAVIATISDGTAAVMFPVQTKTFANNEVVDDFVENWKTNVSWIIEISRKALVSSSATQ